MEDTTLALPHPLNASITPTFITLPSFSPSSLFSIPFQTYARLAGIITECSQNIYNTL
jgi:hypothetical protein